MATPMFASHHSPVGSWASLFFGKAGAGVKIIHEGCGGKKESDLLVALSRDGVTSALPFIADGQSFSGWRIAGQESVRREMSPCIDEFISESAGISLKVYSPHAALPNPKRSGSLQYSTVPGVLMELAIDNSNSDSPATAFVGLNYRGGGKLRPVDWSSKTMCGVANSGKWILAATAVKEEVFTIQSDSVSDRITAGTSCIEVGASTGGIAIKVAPRTKKTVNLVFAFFHQGAATQGVDARYLYNAYFQRIEAVANFILTNSQKVRESCVHFDGRVTAACSDPQKIAAYAQGAREYDAQSQVTDADGVPYFTSLDRSGYRNTLATTVDHLPWELYRNPWVVRNVFDLGTTSYSYNDKIRFPGEDELREGGLTFVHDFGFLTAYSPSGTSAYEGTGKDPQGTPMATEQLLNGVYLLTSYALLADDTPWAKTRLPFARELMVSMENRDHWDPEKRIGILKAQTERAGAGGEVTAMSALGKELGSVPGNLYVAIKTFCANMLLTTYFQNNNDLHSADYSYAFAQKTAAALVAGFNAEAGIIPANLLTPDSATHFIGALEPLALPTYLGLTSTLAEYFPELFNALKSHALTCLKSCVDSGSGALRLSNNVSATLPGKVINVLFVLERLFGIDVQAEHPLFWQNVAASAATDASGLIAAALYVKPLVVAQPV